MVYLLLEAPFQLSSIPSQNNDRTVDRILKQPIDELVIFLFGTNISIQKYIPSLYTTIWDYCLLYGKPDLNCYVIPQRMESDEKVDWSSRLLSESCSTCYVNKFFPKSVICELEDQRGRISLSPLLMDLIPIPDIDTNVIQLDTESAQSIHLHRVCVGGTFDRLHPGHRILLTLASYVCEELIIGLTTDTMLQNKTNYERIKPYNERETTLLSFLHLVSPQLKVTVTPLYDIYGPSVVNEDLEGIIVSSETLEGAYQINAVRHEKSGI